MSLAPWRGTVVARRGGRRSRATRQGTVEKGRKHGRKYSPSTSDFWGGELLVEGEEIFCGHVFSRGLWDYELWGLIVPQSPGENRPYECIIYKLGHLSTQTLPDVV